MKKQEEQLELLFAFTELKKAHDALIIAGKECSKLIEAATLNDYPHLQGWIKELEEV